MAVFMTGSGLGDVITVRCCALATQECHDLAPTQLWDGSVKALLPASTAADIMEVSVNTPIGTSATLLVNSPAVDWMWTDSWASGALNPDGGRLRLVGKALSFSPHAQHAIDCAPLTSASTPPSILPKVTLLAHVGSALLDLDVTLASCYQIEAVVPAGANLTDGLYTIAINNGLPSAAQGIPVASVEVRASAAPTWSPAVFRVGANGNLTHCLTLAASTAGGATVLVPPGVYSMPADEQLLLGVGVQLVGETTDAAAVLLHWDSNTQPIVAISGGVPASAWAVRNLTVLVTSFIANGVHLNGCSGCELTNAVVNVTLPPTMLPPPQNPLYISNAACWKVTDAILVHAGNCSASWPHNTGYFISNATDGLFSGNTVLCGCQGHSTDASQRLIFEGNTVLSLGLDSQGDGFSSFRGALRDIYVGRNVDVGNPAATKRWESMTFDGPGGAYFGFASGDSAPDGSAVGVSLGNGYAPQFPLEAGQLLAIMEGPGLGQFRTVFAVTTLAPGRVVLQLDRPLSTPAVAAASVVSVVQYKGGFTFEGNSWRNGTTVQLFGTAADVVFAGNEFDSVEAALLGWGLTYQGGWQPCYRLLNDANTLRCSGDISSMTSNSSQPAPPIPFAGPFNHAHVHRRNVLQGASDVRVEGYSWDVLVDGNAFSAAVCAGSDTPVGPGSVLVEPGTTQQILVI